MPKAVILFSFKKQDEGKEIIKNLTKIGFNRKDGRRIVFSVEIPMEIHTFSLAEVKTIKDSIEKSTDKVMIEHPDRVWRRAFNAVNTPRMAMVPLYDEQGNPVIDIMTGKQKQVQVDPVVEITGYIKAEGGEVSYSSLTDTGDSNMSDAPVPAAAQPIVAEMKQEESQSQGIVEDDFDVDALVSGLAKTKLGGRRRRKTRRGGKKSRSKSRRH
jgi:predicted regulator of amino acid metabolism with ACT domain